MILAVGLLAVGGFLAGCGTHGDAAALPPVSHAALTAQGAHQALASVTLTPMYGGRIVAYLGGREIPYQNAQNPVQLRDGNCTGAVLAALTANAPGPTGSAAQQAPAARQDPAGGADVALAPDANWNIVVLDHVGGPNAKSIACGSPLSGQKQYFDLYPPDAGVNGTARGIALLQPEIYTRVALSLTQPAAQEETWALHQQSCGGTVITSGSVVQGAQSSTGIAFAAPARGQWWVSIAPQGDGNAIACGQVGR
jgi:hypothetical protein